VGGSGAALWYGREGVRKGIVMSVTAQEPIIADASVEARNPPAGVTFWTRGDGAFSVTYAPPLGDMSAAEMFAGIRAWLDEREAKLRRG
jgi:hypothetical protein